MLETFTDYMALEMVSPFIGVAVIAAIFLVVSVQENRSPRRPPTQDS